MKETNKWSVRDVITTVLLSAVLIVIQLVVNMVCMANDFVSMVLSVGITMFLCAPVYMLMVSRIGKRFVTLIYMTILGVIFLLMGNWFLLPYYVLVGILCEAILWNEGSCQKPKPVSYTHLDVYKRQAQDGQPLMPSGIFQQPAQHRRLLFFSLFAHIPCSFLKIYRFNGGCAASVRGS